MNHLLAFALISFLVIVIPGPSVLFTVGRALTVGRREALLTVAGNAVGAYLQIVDRRPRRRSAGASLGVGVRDREIGRSGVSGVPGSAGHSTSTTDERDADDGGGVDAAGQGHRRRLRGRLDESQDDRLLPRRAAAGGRSREWACRSPRCSCWVACSPRLRWSPTAFGRCSQVLRGTGLPAHPRRMAAIWRRRWVGHDERRCHHRRHGASRMNRLLW